MSIILDIETSAHPAAAEFIPKPDLEAIQAAGNLKDPAKIAASLAERRQAATDAYQESLGKAALDWNLSRIVCLGWHVSGHPEPVAILCANEAAEALALETFWQASRDNGPIIGFYSRSFDLPTMIQRARLIGGLKPPKIDLSPFGRSRDIIDVYDELTFHSNRGTNLMPQNLKSFAKRFGIPVPDETDGKDVPALIAAGDWEGVRSHCLSDIDITRQLAVRLGLLKGWPVA